MSLTPAPWFAGKPIAELCRCPRSRRTGDSCRNVYGPDGSDVTAPCAGLSPEDAEFMALARNAWDVMARRGWGVEKIGGLWFIVTNAYKALREGFPDPYTALVEADAWHKANAVT